VNHRRNPNPGMTAIVVMATGYHVFVLEESAAAVKQDSLLSKDFVGTTIVSDFIELDNEHVFKDLVVDVGRTDYEI
jgi:hypothetical protein